MDVERQRLKHENDLLWKFVANISDQDDTYNGKVAHALMKRFDKEKNKLKKSRMRLPHIKID